jgi:hypothetical protein
MPAKPKPLKEDRVAREQIEKEALQDYRRIQAAYAIHRDFDLCVICFYRYNARRKRQDVHHVYGRGKYAGDWREHYTSLLCTCRQCHPMPIQTPGGNPDLAWVEEILELVKSKPINPTFRAPKD